MPQGQVTAVGRYPVEDQVTLLASVGRRQLVDPRVHLQRAQEVAAALEGKQASKNGIQHELKNVMLC